MELAWVAKVRTEINPGLEPQEPARRVLDLRQKNGNDWEGAPALFGLNLPVESELDFALLPGA